MTPACHPDRKRYARGLCKPCYMRAWMDARPGYHGEWRRKRPYDAAANRRSRLLTRFGMTVDEYDALLETQGGRCAVCRTEDPGGRWGRFAVDHEHATGRVRGLLCLRCNRAVGLIGDSVETALAIAFYLGRPQADQHRRRR